MGENTIKNKNMNVEIFGLNIEYSDQGSGVPILLMHGNPDCRNSWQPVIDRLGGNVRVIAPDFPGFGGSDPLPADFDLGPEGMVKLWNQFIETLGIAEPIIVAVHDFGGPWLLPWVATYPNKVRGLLVLNTLFHPSFRWHFWARVWQTPLLGELSMMTLNRPLLRWELKRGAKNLPDATVNETYDRMHLTMRKTVLRVYRAYAKPREMFAGWQQQLEKVLTRIPSRVIWGDKDPYIPKEFAYYYEAPVIHQPEHGHWVHITNPELVAKTLQELATN